MLTDQMDIAFYLRHTLQCAYGCMRRTLAYRGKGDDMAYIGRRRKLDNYGEFSSARECDTCLNNVACPRHDEDFTVVYRDATFNELPGALKGMTDQIQVLS